MTRQGRWPARGAFRLSVIGACAGLAASAARPAAPYGDARASFSVNDNLDDVHDGHEIYRQYCASCHGRRLQGQPLWQARDPDSWCRAPALGRTGQAWAHDDGELFHITKYGRFGYTPAAQRSAMPAFGTALDDIQIRHVVAYIRANWPAGMRAAHAALGHGGLAQGRWTFPANCVVKAAEK